MSERDYCCAECGSRIGSANLGECTQCGSTAITFVWSKRRHRIRQLAKEYSESTEEQERRDEHAGND